MNKKIISLIVAAGIVTGMGGFGTYAYFTDGESVSNDVNITMGKLDVEANWATDGFNSWTAQSIGDEAKAVDGGETLSFTNVKPGDKFHRDITVKNAGNLKANTIIELQNSFVEGVEVSMAVAKKGSLELFDQVVVDNKKRVEIRESEVGAEYTVRLTVTVPNEGTDNEWMEKVLTADTNNFVHTSMSQLGY